MIAVIAVISVLAVLVVLVVVVPVSFPVVCCSFRTLVRAHRKRRSTAGHGAFYVIFASVRRVSRQPWGGVEWGSEDVVTCRDVKIFSENGIEFTRELNSRANSGQKRCCLLLVVCC